MKKFLGLILGFLVILVELAVVLPAGLAVFLTLGALSYVCGLLRKGAKLAYEWTDRELDIQVVGDFDLRINGD